MTMNFVKVLPMLILHVFSLELTQLVVDSDNCKRLLTSQEVEPHCTFNVPKSAERLEVTCPEEGVLRIVGNYDVIRIDCQAKYTMDFHYTGNKPTEAVVAEFYRREVNDNATNEPGWMNHIQVSIYGLNALKNLHKSNLNHIYSRTGQFSFQGLGSFNRFAKSFYIFLEERNVVPKFITNRETESPVYDRSNVCATIPCLSTHYLSGVSLTSPEIPGISSNYKPTTGLRVCGLSSPVESFKCQLNDQAGRSVASKTVQSVSPPYGLVSQLKKSGDINISYTSKWRDNTTVETFTECSAPGSSLATIGAPNAASYRLLRDFVLPEFQNRSYTVVIGRTIPTTALAGATYCGDSERYRLASFSVDFEPSVAVLDFDIDWKSYFASSNAKYAKIWPNASEELEENTNVDFTCTFNAFLVVPPVAWHEQFSAGQTVVSKSGTWAHGVSEKKVKVTRNLQNITCSAPVWYAPAIEPGRAAFTSVSIKRAAPWTTEKTTTTTSPTTTTTTTSALDSMPTTLTSDVSTTAVPITITTVEPVTNVTILPRGVDPSNGVIVICVVVGILLFTTCVLALIRRFYSAGLLGRRFDIGGLFGRRFDFAAFIQRFRRRSSASNQPVQSETRYSSSSYSPQVTPVGSLREHSHKSHYNSLYPVENESKSHFVCARKESFPDNWAPTAVTEETVL